MMKKIFLLFTLLFISFLYSQSFNTTENLANNNPNRWSYGIKAGFNYATLKGSYTEIDWVDKIDGKIGIYGGAWTNFSLSEKFALQAELIGSLQGGVVKYNEIPNPFTGEMLKPEGEMRLPYIIFPILFQYKPTDKLYFETGPQLNYLLNLNLKAIVNGEEITDPEAANLITNRLENVKDFDFGWNVGVGYEFFDDWMVNLRYTHGMNSIDNREINRRELKNRVVALGVLYKVKIK